ncbi:hypothetical protein JCGZ_00984 [Jatropha curcas]|uniref:RNase H type-1 domain-containing protein n=1 Tax=Jatropha curcas TaxID=180498 RepID=A0A067KSZ5_JATCU|nr:hypothetical protein JCGZ_00984 [Jatropha curcas]
MRFHLRPQKSCKDVAKQGSLNCGSISNPRRARAGAAEMVSSSSISSWVNGAENPSDEWNGFVVATLFSNLQISGFAFVIEGHEGGFCKAVSGLFHGLGSASLTEALALREALALAEDNMPDAGSSFTDSQIVCNALGSCLDDLSEFGCVIKDCLFILARRTNIQVKWIRGQANGGAHTLVRASYS